MRTLSAEAKVALRDLLKRPQRLPPEIEGELLSFLRRCADGKRVKLTASGRRYAMDNAAE